MTKLLDSIRWMPRPFALSFGKVGWVVLYGALLSNQLFVQQVLRERIEVTERMMALQVERSALECALFARGEFRQEDDEQARADMANILERTKDIIHQLMFLECKLGASVPLFAPILFLSGSGAGCTTSETPS